MGSRIMHLIIANKIAEHFSIENKTPFLLGGVAPDAVTTKEKSHFFTGDVNDYSRRIDFDHFLNKYDSIKHSYYILGYYTHLIADDVWLQGFYLPWLKNRLENNKEIFIMYHNDFRLLNGKLLDYYSFTNDWKEELKIPSEMVELEEITNEDMIKFIPYVFEDMDYNHKDLEKPLNVFAFDQIVGYIETSVDRGIMKINPLIKKVSNISI